MKQATQDSIKKALGAKAATLVQEGMLVGLGTGTTAACFIASLIERCQEGLKITAVSSSVRSLEQARAGGIRVLEMDQTTQIDLTVDGADEVDPQNCLIKGGGGAHTREKILATSSKEVVVIVDESKLVEALGGFGLPVEILPFGYRATIHKIERLGYRGKLRQKPDETFYITDNGNYIFDIQTPKKFLTPRQDHEKLIRIAGVVETGFFFDLPIRVLVGHADGRTEFRK